MSKELTEKWKNGTLEIGWYFIRIKDGRCVKDYFKKDFEVFFDTYIEEVLAKVPTYDQFSQLVKKVEELEKRLKEANEMLRWAEAKVAWGFEITPIEKYFRKWGVK